MVGPVGHLRPPVVSSVRVLVFDYYLSRCWVVLGRCVRVATLLLKMPMRVLVFVRLG